MTNIMSEINGLVKAAQAAQVPQQPQASMSSLLSPRKASRWLPRLRQPSTNQMPKVPNQRPSLENVLGQRTGMQHQVIRYPEHAKPAPSRATPLQPLPNVTPNFYDTELYPRLPDRRPNGWNEYLPSGDNSPRPRIANLGIK